MKFIPLFLFCAVAHASITLTTPYSIPVPSGGALTTLSLTTIACQGVDVDVVHGVASDKCYFCNDIVNAGKEVSCVPIAGVSPISLQLIHATGVLTIIFEGQSIGGTTYAGAALTSAWNFDTTQTAAAIQNATEQLLLPASGQNLGGLGIVQGAQNATW